MYWIYIMGFYFCGRSIRTKGDSKQVENDMYDVPIFRDSYDLYGYEARKINLKSFFSYFALSSEQKCHYAQMKLVEESYHWVNDNYKFCRCLSQLQSFRHTRYAPNLLYADCKDCLLYTSPSPRDS